MLRFLIHSIIHPFAILRALLYKKGLFGTSKLPGKVISVGNISTGGTGKSPVTISICQHLITTGKKPVILTRGYKSGLKGDQSVIFLGSQMLPNLGPLPRPWPKADEARMQAEKLGTVPVIVGKNRHLAALSYLRQYPPPSHWILDDGFQHLKIGRDIDILLLDPKQATCQTQSFFAGILREPFNATKRADAVLFTRCGESAPLMKLTRLLDAWALPYWLVPFSQLDPVSPQGHKWQKEVEIGVLTAIANPYRMVAQLKIKVSKTFFKSDHSSFSGKEVLKFADSVDAIVTTEKDYWRDPEVFNLKATPVFFIPIEPQIPLDFFTKMDLN